MMALPQHSSSGGPRHGVPTRTADVRGQHPPSGCASPRVRHPWRGGQSSGTLPRLFLRTSGLGTVGMRQTLPPVRKAGRRPLPRRVVSALSSSCGGQMRVRSRRLAVFFFFITPPRDAASLRRDSDAMGRSGPTQCHLLCGVQWPRAPLPSSPGYGPAPPQLLHRVAASWRLLLFHHAVSMTRSGAVPAALAAPILLASARRSARRRGPLSLHIVTVGGCLLPLIGVQPPDPT